jgi:hypothetical protein
MSSSIMLRHFDCLPLVAEARQDLNQTAQEDVACQQEEKEHENHLEKARDECARAGEYGDPETGVGRGLRRAGAGRRGRLAADITFREVQKVAYRFDGRAQKAEVLLQARDALRQLRRPRCGRPRQCSAERDDGAKQYDDQKKGAQHSR